MKILNLLVAASTIFAFSPAETLACSTEYGTFACGYTAGSSTSEYSEVVCIGGQTVKNGLINIEQGIYNKNKSSELKNTIVRDTLIDAKGNLNFGIYNAGSSFSGVMRSDYILYEIFEVPKNWESIEASKSFEASIYTGSVGDDGKIPSKEDMNKKTLKLARRSCSRR